MNRSIHQWFLAVIGAMLLGGYALPGGAAPAETAAESTQPAVPEAPPAPREFRAAWVASVANIDWPSRRDLTVARQQAEIIALLDRAQSLKLNAIVLQVRPSADALYPSALEPWSEYLTGEQGRAPDPFYDPLKMWIDEAHRRGMELHAWFNPYRARHSLAKSPPAAKHLSNTQPQLVKKYGNQLWIDPGEPAAVRHTLEVFLDVVRRYDIDGVQIDDYFYPYPIEAPAENGSANSVAAPMPGKRMAAEQEFPDNPSWQAYLAQGGELPRAGWRRKNVDDLVEMLYREIHREKRWIRVGVSPFGLGRPDNRPPGIAGFSQYDKLYADVELWLNKGWLDYLAPQLYWPIDQAPQAFGVLLDYWAGENRQGRHLWPGLFTSRIENSDTPNSLNGPTKSWQPDEIRNQIAMIRSRPQAGGHIHFSMVALLEDRKGIAHLLRSGPYATAALVPATPWLDATVPPAPLIDVQRSPEPAGTLKLKVRPGNGKPPVNYAIWMRHGKLWRFSVQPASQPEIELDANASQGQANAIVVSAVDRLGNESPRVSVELTPPNGRP